MVNNRTVDRITTGIACLVLFSFGFFLIFMNGYSPMLFLCSICNQPVDRSTKSRKLCFVFCLFLSPLASVIPSCATAPALIYVGVLMARNFAKVDMDDMLSAVPAFLALIMMPLTYSISNGIGIGAIAYVVIALFTGNYKKKDIVITVIAALFVCKFIFVTM